MRLGLTAATLAALAAFATASGAHAANLVLGTTNTSNASTTLTGNPAAPELLVRNTNGSSANAFGLYGLLTATSPSASAAAVRGHNSATNANGFGVYGSQAGSGTGVRGVAPSGKGVWGSSTSGIGVSGNHTGTSGFVAGVQGQSAGLEGTGIKGIATNGGYAKAVWGVSDSGYGGYFEAPGPLGYGVYATGTKFGLRSESASGQGVYGHSGGNSGVVGESTYSDGILGLAHGGSIAGVTGQNDAAFGYGVRGVASSALGIGVFGSGVSRGVYGFSDGGIAVYGRAPSGYAGVFDGNVEINGTCFGCAGAALKIDHPLDPAHTYLQHSTVVSPRMKDVYDGVVTTNQKGFATVKLPRYFQALNRSFRYQLTIVGTRGWNARVIKEIAHNRFTIQSDRPRVKVSWLVTGIRHDRYANAHRIQVVLPKAKNDQGKYLHPELYGKSKSKAIGYREAPTPPRRALGKP